MKNLPPFNEVHEAIMAHTNRLDELAAAVGHIRKATIATQWSSVTAHHLAAALVGYEIQPWADLRAELESHGPIDDLSDWNDDMIAAYMAIVAEHRDTAPHTVTALKEQLENGHDGGWDLIASRRAEILLRIEGLEMFARQLTI